MWRLKTDSRKDCRGSENLQWLEMDYDIWERLVAEFYLRWLSSISDAILFFEQWRILLNTFAHKFATTAINSLHSITNLYSASESNDVLNIPVKKNGVADDEASNSFPAETKCWCKCFRSWFVVLSLPLHIIGIMLVTKTTLFFGYSQLIFCKTQ